MLRIGMVLSLALGAAFVVDVMAQPPAGDRDGDRGPRDERRDGDRGPRDGDRDRGPRDRDGDRGPRDRDGDRERYQRVRMLPNPILLAIDADKNGELSQEEISKASEALMSLDKNGDKKLSREELRPQFDRESMRRDFSPERFVARMMEQDANGDGKLSKEEVSERMRNGFDRLDENGDGSLDKQELGQIAERFGDRDRGPRDGDRRGRRDGDRPGSRDGDRPERDRPDNQDDADEPGDDPNAPVSSDDL